MAIPSWSSQTGARHRAIQLGYDDAPDRGEFGDRGLALKQATGLYRYQPRRINAFPH